MMNKDIRQLIILTRRVVTYRYDANVNIALQGNHKKISAIYYPIKKGE